MKFIFIIVAFFLTSCDKTEIRDDNYFSVQTKHKPGICWLLLHSLDGQVCTQAIRINGDQVYEFGELDTNRITISLVRITDVVGTSEWPSISIVTYYNVPTGSWIFKGKDIFFRGTATFTAHNEIKNYSSRDGGYVSLPGEKYSAVDADNPMGIIALDDNEKMTAFIYEPTLSGDTVFCGWLVNKDFVPNSSSYDIPITRLMRRVNVFYSRPFDYVEIRGYRGILGHSYILYRSDFNFSSEPRIFYPLNSPFGKLAFHGYFYGYDHAYYFDYVAANEIPSSLYINDAAVSATYNYHTQTFENIDVNGDADLIAGYWQGESSTNHAVNWTVYRDKNSSMIGKPFVPDSILISMSVMPYDTSWIPGGVMIEDYNSTGSLDDIVKRFWITDKYSVSLYTTRYTYFWFNRPQAKNKFMNFFQNTMLP